MRGENNPPKADRRKTIRLKEYDYSLEGEYFITVCTKDRENLFGEITNDEMVLNEVGRIAEKCWREIPKHFPNVELDIFQIMPNHVHFMLRIVCKKYCRGVIYDAHQKSVLTNDKEGVVYDAPTGFDKRYFSEISLRQGLLSRIIQNFKASVTRICGQNNLSMEWQRNYYEEIIRNEKHYNEVYDYIQSNPQTWERDKNNLKNICETSGQS